MLYGGVQHNPPSRFLSEIDAEFQTGESLEPAYTFGQSAKNEYDQSQDEYNQEPRYIPELNEGDGVRHQTFGTGTVVDVDGDTVTVYFRGKGARKLNVAFAPLEKL
jgi:transcription elongation factor GreA-like protein